MTYLFYAVQETQHLNAIFSTADQDSQFAAVFLQTTVTDNCNLIQEILLTYKFVSIECISKAYLNSKLRICN